MEAIEKNIADCRPLVLKEDLDLALEHLQTSQLDGFGTAKVINTLKKTHFIFISFYSV